MPWPGTACCARPTPTPSTAGWTTTGARGCRACWPTCTAAPAAGTAFSRQQELEERLRQGPGDQARNEAAARPDGPAPSRWTLPTIRATFDWLAEYTLSGVWRLLHRCGLRLRSAPG